MELPSDEQRQLIKTFALLPMIIYIFQRDKKVIAASPLKTKGPYLYMLDSIIDRCEKDLRECRKSLREAGIEIIFEQRNNEGVELKYLFKRYKYQAHYPFMTMKADIEEIMKTYLIPPS